MYTLLNPMKIKCVDHSLSTLDFDLDQLNFRQSILLSLFKYTFSLISIKKPHKSKLNLRIIN